MHDSAHTDKGSSPKWLSHFYDSSISLKDKSILVTGGTGSFGKRFISSVLERHDVRRLIIYSRDELKQYEMQEDLSPRRYPCLRYFIGDVRDRDRLEIVSQERDLRERKSAIDNRLKAAMGDASYGVLPNGRTFSYCANKNGVRSFLAPKAEEVGL